MEKKLEYTVTREDVPGNINDILKKRLGLSGHQISSAKYRRGGISRNGSRARISEAVSPGDRIEVLLEEAGTVSERLEAVPGPVEILYEDPDLAVVNKPPGLVLHPAHGHWRDTLANYMQYYYESQNLRVKIRAVGRLDRDTSGIVLFAKNQVAAARLWGREGGTDRSEDKREDKSEDKSKGKQKDGRPVEKEYWALAEGHLEQKQGRIELPLGKKSGALNQMEVREGGYTAVTNYRVLEEYPEMSLVSLKLETGRTHQIRVHMAALGHPLLGDRLYGGSCERIERAALHCRSVTISQPFTGEELRIQAPLPADMKRLIGKR